MRLACCNKIPSRANSSDRELFTSLLDKQKEIINEVYVPVDVKTNANGNIKQLLILLFHLCEQSGEIKDQEVLAQDLAKSQSRHVKENASVERKNLVTRKAGRRSLEKSTKKMTA